MALYETIQDFPAQICISGCRLTPRNVVGVSTSSFTLKRQSQIFAGQRWEIELDFLPMERHEAGTLEAFLMSLRGGAGRFRMGDPFQSMPRGQAIGQPKTSAANAGDEILIVSGFLPNVLKQLAANDRIQIGDHLYAVLADASSDNLGDSILNLWPSLRESYADDTPIITRNARGVFSLSDTPTFSRNNVELYGTNLTAVESL